MKDFLSVLFHELLMMILSGIIGIIVLCIVGWVKTLFDKILESSNK